MYCKKCGNEISKSVEYCEHCGEANEIFEVNGEARAAEEEEEYEGSRPESWSIYLKVICYILWVLSTVGGMAIGYSREGYRENETLNMLLGGAIGFALGFMVIAVEMLIITACENISIMTDNTAKILRKLDERKK